MRPYGYNQEYCRIDRKRRYLSRAMSHEDRREERRDKRAARAEGKAEIVEQTRELDAAADDVPGEDVFRCSPHCEFCNTSETAEDVFEAMTGLRRAANIAVMGWSPK